MYNPYANSEPSLSSRGPAAAAAQQHQQAQFQSPNIQQPQPLYGQGSASTPGFGGTQPNGAMGASQHDNQQHGIPNIFNSTQANLGLQFTQGALNMAQQNVSNYIPKENLKSYFKVDNRYVYQKLSLLMFPFKNNKWSRSISQHQNAVTDKLVFAPPTDDINAPDLYIPLMGFITVILITSVTLGIHDEFNPQVLSLLFSKEIAIYLLDFFLLWAGFFIFNIQDYKYYDILSYTGYKFVPISILLLFKNFITSGWAFYLAFVYLLVSYGVFLIRSMRSIVFPNGSVSSKSRTKEVSIFVYSFILQALYFLII